jgi:hypothetical protein
MFILRDDMAQPLDYRSPRDLRPGDGKPIVRPAMPVELDTLLAQTDDLAAARAVEVALHREKIDVYVGESATPDAPIVGLYIRACDFDKALAVANQVFAHRKRLKSLPRQEVPRARTFPLRG